MRAAGKLAVALAVVAAVLLACNTPTIPIPPLGAPTFQSPAQEVWIASGTGAPAAAEIVLINRATGDGVVTRVDQAGAWMTAPFGGAGGDIVELFYRTTTGDVSPSVCSMLATGTPGTVTCPSP